MDHGAGSFVFIDPAAGTRGSIRVFYFRPPRAGPDTPIVIAMHGFDRASSDFRDCLVTSAERLDLVVLVPEFDAEAFPTAHSYNYGNVRLPPPDETFIQRDDWNFGLIDRLFERVRAEIVSNTGTFNVWSFGRRSIKSGPICARISLCALARFA
jgi:hypothetical protein